MAANAGKVVLTAWFLSHADLTTKLNMGWKIKWDSMSILADVDECSAAATCWWLCWTAAHLDVAPNLGDEHTPEHAGILHLKALEGDGDVFEARHVQCPGKGALLLGPSGARCQVATEAAGEGESRSQLTLDPTQKRCQRAMQPPALCCAVLAAIPSPAIVVCEMQPCWRCQAAQESLLSPLAT